jgi:hypothetical protein
MPERDELRDLIRALAANDDGDYVTGWMVAVLMAQQRPDWWAELVTRWSAEMEGSTLRFTLEDAAADLATEFPL